MSNKKEDIKPRNSDGYGHGLWIWYWDNGNLMCKQRFINGILHGIHEEYLSNGDLFYKKYWNNSKFVYRESYGIINRIEFTI